MFGPRRIRKKETTLGLSSLICTAASSFSMGVVATAASLFSHGLLYTLKKPFMANGARKSKNWYVSLLAHTVKLIRLGFFQTGSCNPTHFGVRPKSTIQAKFLVRIAIPSVIRTIHHWFRGTNKFSYYIYRGERYITGLGAQTSFPTIYIVGAANRIANHVSCDTYNHARSHLGNRITTRPTLSVMLITFPGLCISGKQRDWPPIFDESKFLFPIIDYCNE